jgi:signal transduction histidine kinase
VLRRRWTEERLAQQAARLARGNQALGDFAALVAHDLKTPLELARLQDDPSVGVERALELVDVLLEAAQQAGERLPALQLVGDARPISAAREPQRAARGP